MIYVLRVLVPKVEGPVAWRALRNVVCGLLAGLLVAAALLATGCRPEYGLSSCPEASGAFREPTEESYRVARSGDDLFLVIQAFSACTDLPWIEARDAGEADSRWVLDEVDCMEIDYAVWSCSGEVPLETGWCSDTLPSTVLYLVGEEVVEWGEDTAAPEEELAAMEVPVRLR